MAEDEQAGLFCLSRYLSISRSMFVLRTTQHVVVSRCRLCMDDGTKDRRLLALDDTGVDVCCLRLFSLTLPDFTRERERKRSRWHRKSSMIYRISE